MRYQNLGNSGLNASVVSFGTWGLGGGSAWSDRTVTEQETERLLDAAKELGINYIDTAPVYGTGVSEELLGKALRGRRNDFLLQTKCSLNWRNEGGNFHYERDGYTVNNDTSARAVKHDVEDSLRRLQTDRIDVIVVHYVCGSWPAEETMCALQDLIREGKVRAVGLSNSKPADLDAYERVAPVALVQEQYSLLAPYHGEAYFGACRAHGTTFQVYGALEEGFLTAPDYVERTFPKGDVRGKLPWTSEPIKGNIKKLFTVLTPLTEKYGCSYANLVQAWTLAQYPDMNLLTGFRSEKTIADTVKALDLRLDPEDLLAISEAARPAQVRELDK
ncbi:MAG: aldo/keto reductase [Clostridia bacterium]|nr:aldo/keto reductase [Clostridia bacterium]